MDFIIKRIEQAKKILEEKEELSYNDHIIMDLLLDVEDLLKKNENPSWIRVEDRLPKEEGQLCWVWSSTDWDKCAIPEMDTWEGDRGQRFRWANGPEETRDGVKSGWYSCMGMNITHWMPAAAPKSPEPPAE